MSHQYDLNLKKQIFQYIRKITSSKKGLEIDQVKHRVRRKTNLDTIKTDKIIDEMLIEGILIIEDNKIKVNILANPIRNNIYQIIEKYPGIYPNLIKNMLCIGTNQLIWHLSVLELNSVIKSKNFGNISAYSLPNVSSLIILVGFLSIKKSSRKILISLCKNPGIKRAKLTELLKMAKSTMDYWIKKLIKLEIIYVVKQKTNQYFIVDEEKSNICGTLKQFLAIVS